MTLTDRHIARWTKKTHELYKRMQMGRISPHTVFAALQALIEGKAAPDSMLNVLYMLYEARCDQTDERSVQEMLSWDCPIDLGRFTPDRCTRFFPEPGMTTHDALLAMRGKGLVPVELERLLAYSGIFPPERGQAYVALGHWHSFANRCVPQRVPTVTRSSCGGSHFASLTSWDDKATWDAEPSLTYCIIGHRLPTAGAVKSPTG